MKNPVYQAPGVLDPEKIMFITRDGNNRQMSGFPNLLTATTPADDRLHVICTPDAPLVIKISSISDRQERRKSQRELEHRIKEIIEKSVGERS